MKDLTKGKPSTLILAFALPIFFANLLQLTYSLVDTRIVGTFLGEDALAAVGATTTLSNLIIGFLQGLSGGFAIIIAQKFGAKDYKNVKKSFAMSLTMGTGIAIFFTVFGLLFLQPILNLVILAISVALNIVGDLLFVVVLKSGVRGAAIATVLAQAIAFVVCWIYMVKRYELLRLSREDFKDPNPVMVKNMLGAGMSMGFMSSLINIGSLTLQTAINKLGNDYIVAQTAARKLTEMFMIMFTVFGNTMATYCGQNLGAGKIDRIKKGIWLSILYTCIWCTFAIIASYTIGDKLVYLVTGTDNKNVIENATRYLKFDTLFYYVTAVICIVRNAMQGLDDHITPIVSSMLEMVGKIVIAFTLVPHLGYTGVIIAEPIVWFVMVIPLIVQIFRMPVLKQTSLS